MTVWVVEEFNNWEGGETVVAVFASPESALAWCRKRWPNTTWVGDDEVRVGDLCREPLSDAPPDYSRISRFEVQS